MYERLLLVLWRDKRIVSAVSSVYGTTFVENQKYLKTEKKHVKFDKPSMVHYYNKNMHDVDRADQNLSYYDFNRKTVKWWKKVFFYLIQIGLTNSYVIYKSKMAQQSQQPMTPNDFRIEIVEQLLQNNSKYQEYKTPRPQTDSSMHLIEKIPNDRHFVRQKRCVYPECKARPTTQCFTCQKALCMSHFKPYHVE